MATPRSAPSPFSTGSALGHRFLERWSSARWTPSSAPPAAIPPIAPTSCPGPGVLAFDGLWLGESKFSGPVVRRSSGSAPWQLPSGASSGRNQPGVAGCAGQTLQFRGLRDHSAKLISRTGGPLCMFLGHLLGRGPAASRATSTGLVAAVADVGLGEPVAARGIPGA